MILLETIGSFARGIGFNPFDIGDVSIIDFEMQCRIIQKQKKKDEEAEEQNRKLQRGSREEV